MVLSGLGCDFDVYLKGVFPMVLCKISGRIYVWIWKVFLMWIWMWFDVNFGVDLWVDFKWFCLDLKGGFDVK